MTVAIDTVVVAESSSSSSLSISNTPAGSDRVQICGVSAWNAEPTSVTFNTTEGHTKINAAGDATIGFANFWRRIAPTATTANTVVAFAAGEEVVAVALNLTGAHQTTPITDSDGSSSSGVTSTSTPALTSATGELCLDCLLVDLHQPRSFFHGQKSWEKKWYSDQRGSRKLACGGCQD